MLWKEKLLLIFAFAATRCSSQEHSFQSLGPGKKQTPSSENVLSGSAEAPVLPPVPVSGSFLTSVLIDEQSSPMVNTTVSADSGRTTTRTNDEGLFSLPVSAVIGNVVNLNISREGRSLLAKLILSPDLVAAIDVVRSSSSKDVKEVGRVMTVRVPRNVFTSVSNSTPSQSKGLVLETLSLPKSALNTPLRDSPLMKFRVISHKNGDVAAPAIALSGECAVGFVVRVKGEVELPKEINCASSGEVGLFKIDVVGARTKENFSIVLEHAEPASGIYISRILQLQNPPLNAFNDGQSNPPPASPPSPIASPTPTDPNASHWGFGVCNQMCTGPSRVFLNQKYNKWIKVVTCSPSQYDIFMAEAQSGPFYKIGDFGGHGQDHCELVNSSFGDLPSDDDITSGGCSACDIRGAGSVSGVPNLKGSKVYARSRWGQSFEFVDTTTAGAHTSCWYKCGVAF